MRRAIGGNGGNSENGYLDGDIARMVITSMLTNNHWDAILLRNMGSRTISAAASQASAGRSLDCWLTTPRAFNGPAQECPLSAEERKTFAHIEIFSL
jgi:hypothetical protein